MFDNLKFCIINAGAREHDASLYWVAYAQQGSKLEAGTDEADANHSRPSSDAEKVKQMLGDVDGSELLRKLSVEDMQAHER